MTQAVIKIQAETLCAGGAKKRRIAYDKDAQKIPLSEDGYYHCSDGDWVVQSEWHPELLTLVFYCGYATSRNGNGLLLQRRSDWHADVPDIADRNWLKFR